MDNNSTMFAWNPDLNQLVSQRVASSFMSTWGGSYGSAGQVLTSQGNSSSWSWTTPFGYTLHVLTSNTTFTPTAGASQWVVYAIGGGGSSGSGNSNYDDSARVGKSGGGGGGGASLRIYNATEMGANAAVTVGNGGSAPNWANSGNAGGTTTFNPAGTGATISGSGGNGSGVANEWTQTAGGTGGSGSGGTYNWDGTQGGHGNSGQEPGEPGSKGPFGASDYGRGGSGRTHGSHTPGYAGQSGVVYIEEY